MFGGVGTLPMPLKSAFMPRMGAYPAPRRQGDCALNLSSFLRVSATWALTRAWIFSRSMPLLSAVSGVSLLSRVSALTPLAAGEDCSAWGTSFFSLPISLPQKPSLAFWVGTSATDATLSTGTTIADSAIGTGAGIGSLGVSWAWAIPAKAIMQRARAWERVVIWERVLKDIRGGFERSV